MTGRLAAAYAHFDIAQQRVEPKGGSLVKANRSGLAAISGRFQLLSRILLAAVVAGSGLLSPHSVTAQPSVVTNGSFEGLRGRVMRSMFS